MLKPLTLISLFVLVVTFASVQAQDEPAPWPPDPADIFAPGVEVEDTERFEPPQFDNLSRQIRIFDQELGWREFSYPDQLDSIKYLEAALPEQLVFTIGKTEAHQVPFVFWTLDIQESRFSRQALFCGIANLSQRQVKWVAETDYDTRITRLCNTATGELTDPLPEMIDYPADGLAYTKKISTSPNGDWVILFTSGSGYHVYAYEFATGKLNDLGGGEGDEGDAVWLDNSHILIKSRYIPSQYPVNAYLADATIGNSMHYLTSWPPFADPYYDNPPRYEWVETKEDRCILVTLNLETVVRTEYDLDVCSWGIILPDGSGDRLVSEYIFQDNLPVSANLFRFNPYTSERVDLLHNTEMEWHRDVSPDGKYSVVLLDDNGIFDMFLNLDHENSQPRWAIVDLTDGEIVYEIATTWDTQSFSYLGFDEATGQIYDSILSNDELSWDKRTIPVDSFFALGNNLFLQITYTNAKQINYKFVELAEDQIVEYELTDISIELIFPERKELLIWTDGRVSAEASLYNIVTGATLPVIKDIPINNYSSGVIFTDNYDMTLAAIPQSDLISVKLTARNEEGQNQSPSVIYTIRIPQAESQLPKANCS